MAKQGTGKPSRRERERQRHRLEILDAAERVFARKGYHGASVEEIAQEAEFAVGTLYNFFKGKEEMYVHVVEKIAHEFMGLLEERVLVEPDAYKAVSALIELRLTHMEGHSGFVRVFFDTTPGSQIDPARALPEICAHIYDRYIEIVSDIFRRGVSKGQFAQMDPLYLALCLEGMINALVAYGARKELAEPLRVRIDKMREAFLSRFRQPMHDPAGPKPMPAAPQKDDEK